MDNVKEIIVLYLYINSVVIMFRSVMMSARVSLSHSPLLDVPTELQL